MTETTNGKKEKEIDRKRGGETITTTKNDAEVSFDNTQIEIQ